MKYAVFQTDGILVATCGDDEDGNAFVEKYDGSGDTVVSIISTHNGGYQLDADQWYTPEGEFQMRVNNVNLDAALTMFAVALKAEMLIERKELLPSKVEPETTPAYKYGTRHKVEEYQTFFVLNGLLNGEEGVEAATAGFGVILADGWYYIFDGMDDGAGTYKSQQAAEKAAVESGA